MLTLNHINKSFSSKIIFDDTNFIANPNELTILIGPSGAGKTTLFNIILNIENCDYTFNNDNISDLDKKEKEQFILDNISYASQKPTFIADLKMNDQIALLKQIYNNDYDVSELITLFELNKLLECYPNQLSGGEKARFAFILALLKPARIYMFDEPTSALDDLQASRIVTVLNNLKKQGNIVIISTHDHRLIEQGDKVYEIENKQLNLKKEILISNIQIKDNIERKNFQFNKVSSILSGMKKHHKTYNRIMNFLLALGIVISMCGIEVGYLVKYNFDLYTENKASDILLINKQYELNKNMNQNTGIPIEEKELNKIKNTKHIENMYPFLSYELSLQIILKNNTYISNKEKVEFDYDKDHKFDLAINLNEEKQNISLSYEESNDGSFTTYPEQINIEDKILEEWNDEGLYISYDFYKTYVKPMIKKDEDKKNIRITYPLTVPVYNSQGHIIGEGNKLVGFYLVLDMKIKGVMKKNNIVDVPYDVTNFNFSLSNKEMQKYIDKYKVNESHKCFFYKDLNRTICDEPVDNYIKNYDAITAVHNYLSEYTPYQPNAYIIQVDDVKNLKKVKKNLEEMGYQVYSRYITVDTFETAQKNIQNTILVVSCITFSLILLMNILIKLNNKKEESSFQHFFKEKGFTKKMINKLNKERFMIDCFDMTCYVVVEFVLIDLIMYLFTNMYLLDFKMGAVGIVLVFFTEYIIPMCLEHYYSKEETSC